MERYYLRVERFIPVARLILALALVAPLLYLYTQPVAYVEGALFHGWVGPGASQLYYAGSPWRPSPLLEAHTTYRLGLAGSLLGLAGLLASEARRDPHLTEASGYIIVFSTAVSLSAARVPLVLARLLEGAYIYETSLGTLSLGEVTVKTLPVLGVLDAYASLWLPLALGLALLSASAQLAAGGEPRES